QQSARGILFGIPLPICSCGVLPLYESLLKRGAPPAAALAFLVATPELGVDALFLSVPLLGVPLTLTRIAAAVLIAITVALMMQHTIPAQRQTVEPNETEQPTPLPGRLRAGMKYGLVDLVDYTMPWILAGLAFAAMLEPLLGHDVLQQLPSIVQVPLFALIGIPLYVCASGATPMAAMAVHKGISAGAALAFLLAGPATNLTTFGMLSKLHGRKIAAWFGLAVVGLAVVIGWVVDILGAQPPEVLHLAVDADAPPGLIAWICAAILTGLSLASLLRLGPRGVLAQIMTPVHPQHS
ncbi:MAG: permease, partial [Myxococcota bacterium]